MEKNALTQTAKELTKQNPSLFRTIEIAQNVDGSRFHSQHEVRTAFDKAQNSYWEMSNVLRKLPADLAAQTAKFLVECQEHNIKLRAQYPKHNGFATAEQIAAMKKYY